MSNRDAIALVVVMCIAAIVVVGFVWDASSLTRAHVDRIDELEKQVSELYEVFWRLFDGVERVEAICAKSEEPTATPLAEGSYRFERKGRRDPFRPNMTPVTD